MADVTTHVDEVRTRRVTNAALGIRRSILQMAEVQGQGYVGQGLAVADVLAVLYFDRLRYRAEDPEWEDRDRLLLSIGHYALALYAALGEAGVLDKSELPTYGADDSRLPMSGMSTYTPGMEISGGSLGHGLGIGVGMALGLRHQGRNAHVYDYLSDGELDEGATWEAAMAAAHHRLGGLTAIVDVNALQADGPTANVLKTESVTEKWRAFGWAAHRVDGNDVPALLAAFDAAQREDEHTPRAIVCDTLVGRGIELLENREKAHFMRIDDDEWATCRTQLEERYAR
ncbi:MAG: transketolase [Solirubrobacterales bacterium]|nr:transketolase [Solirubrobacterales bacterium]